jgi:serine/threonine protein kinase
MSGDFLMSPMDIICPNCGSSDYDDNNVCGACGFFVNQLPVGTILINRYEIKKAIKAGGMGAVYLGYDVYDDRICAIKQMFIYEENKEINDYITKRFLDEARLMSELDHPSIPKVTDFFNENTYNYYMIMDYIEGCDLYTYVTEHKLNISEEIVLKWAIEVCDVLDYLHSRPTPIIHRDLTPANLILSSKNNRLMLVDFGFARPLDQHASMNTSVGTEMYAAPEQCVGYPQTRSDIFSLGATMYFLLTKEQSPLYRPPLIKIRPDVSEATRWIVEKAMNFAPDERFPSAMEMYQALSKGIKATISSAGNMPDSNVTGKEKRNMETATIPPAGNMPGSNVTAGKEKRKMETAIIPLAGNVPGSNVTAGKEKRKMETAIIPLAGNMPGSNVAEPLKTSGTVTYKEQEKKRAPRTSLLPKERTLAHIRALKREVYVPEIEEPAIDDNDEDDFLSENDEFFKEKEGSEEVFLEVSNNIPVEKKGIIARLTDIIMKWFGKK